MTHASCKALIVRRSAFTLLEMLAVVTIIGIIAAIIVPCISGQAFHAKVEVCHQYRADLNAALDRYWFDQGVFATSLAQIHGNDYYPEAIPDCPVAGAAYSIDPTTHRIDGHDH